MTAAEIAFENFEGRVGEPEGTGDWFEITQERIDDFADVTLDHQFIHVDQEAAEQGPFGTTIAHGFLTLSMLTHLAASLPVDPDTMKGAVMGINYGFDKVRFISPVPSGSRIRASTVLKDAQLKDPDTVQVTRTYTIEIEGAERPAVVADWITRLTYA